MGSLAAWVVLTDDDLPCFRSGGEVIGEVGCSRQQRGLENGVGSEALTGEGCQGRQSKGAVVALSSFRCSCVGAGRAETRWRLRAPSGAPAQGRRVRG
jgi:hypothetical protein